MMTDTKESQPTTYPGNARFIATERLVDARKKRNWTQDEVAGLVVLEVGREYMSRQHYQKIESGDRSVSTELAVGIARVFNIPVEQLFTKREVSNAA